MFVYKLFTRKNCYFLSKNALKRYKGGNNMREIFSDESGKYIKDERNAIRMTPCILAKDVDSYLGEVDAWGEWKKDRDLARHMFLHTDAYTEFLKDSSLILLGRTGVGKTAILLSAEEHMKNGENCRENFSSVTNIDTTELLIYLSNCIELSTLSPITISSEIKKIINVFITTAIMKDIVLNSSCKNQELKIIEKYLDDNGFIKHSNWKNFISIFLDETENIDINNEKIETARDVTKSITRIVEKFRSKGFGDAEEALGQYLSKNGRAVVLIDSLNEYNVNNKDMVLIVKGLIEMCFHYYNNPDINILLKIALPSEIYNKVLTKLPSKEMGNTVVINWKYKELVILLALRIYAKYKAGSLELFPFCEKYKDYDVFYADTNKEAYADSLDLISNFLPEVCPTTLTFPFLTLPYCIRHTLKKPREIIYMFNVIIDTLYKYKDVKYFVNHPEKIKETIHKTQERMIGSALSMYANTYESIYAACKLLVHNRYFVFQGKDISNDIKRAVYEANNVQNQLKTTADYIDNGVQYLLDEVEFKRILLESGLVGKIANISTINEDNVKLGNNEKICILSANFDFNVSATAASYMFIDDDQYVFHPMCYENYLCLIDKNTLVYPIGDDESDRIIETMVAEQL